MSVKSNGMKTRLSGWPGVASLMRLIASCAFSSLRQRRKTLQPFLWSSRAVMNPIPSFAPVTAATWGRGTRRKHDSTQENLVGSPCPSDRRDQSPAASHVRSRSRLWKRESGAAKSCRASIERFFLYSSIRCIGLASAWCRCVEVGKPPKTMTCGT